MGTASGPLRSLPRFWVLGHRGKRNGGVTGHIDSSVAHLVEGMATQPATPCWPSAPRGEDRHRGMC